MYKDYRRTTDTNGYILVHMPEHHKAMLSGGFKGYVYEHVLIAEQDVIDRKIKEGEVVHHLDENKTNNSPDNLLVLENPAHSKLHTWLDKYKLEPTDKQLERINLGCIRCLVCEKPINFGYKYCSDPCYRLDTNAKSKPSKEILEEEVKTIPMVKLGEKYGVSDTAVKKWCKNYSIDLPKMRGHWTKVKYNKI